MLGDKVRSAEDTLVMLARLQNVRDLFVHRCPSEGSFLKSTTRNI